MMFFGLEAPQANAARGTRGSAAATPFSTASGTTSAWKQSLHDSPLGHVLRADGRVHAAAMKGAKQWAAIYETTEVNDTPTSKRDVETANATESGHGRQAPNGQASNLTAEQRQKVDTPEFKQQFGDWEAESNRAFLQGKPVAFIQTDTIKDQGQGPIQAAKAWAEKYLPPFIKRSDLGRIITTPNTIAKSLSHKFGKVKLSAVTAVQQVLENGRVILSTKDKNGKPITHVLIAAPVEVDNSPYVMVARVKSDMNGKRFHIHELFLTEKIRELATLQSGPRGSQELLAETTGRKLYEKILQDLFSVNHDTISKIVDVNGEPLVAYPVGSQGGTGLTFTTDKSRTSNEGTLDQPVFLKGFTEGEDFSWDRGSGLITVNSKGQVIPVDTIDSEKHSSDRSNESFKSYEDYWIQNNPEYKILTLIEKYKLSKHLSGKQVVYSGSKLGVSGGVHPLFPDVIKIYDEGLSFDDRYFVETLIEEIHHSKFLKLYPDSGLPRNNKWWNSFVEPRAKEYAKHYADRIFGSHEGN